MARLRCGMQFIGHLDIGDRERLMAEGAVVHVAAGTHLLRRGEDGGDIYLIESGRLEVVDARLQPEVVLDILGPGRVVGEMAFVDASPRAADVRAVEDCAVRHWSRDALLRVLDGDVGLSARFYTAITRAAVGRLRQTDQIAVGMVHAHGIGAMTGMSAAAAEEARTLALAPRSIWAAAEEAIAQGEVDLGSADIEGALMALVESVDVWLSSVTSVSRAQEAGGVLRTELRSWLTRSQAGLIGIDRRSELGGRLSFLAHLLLNRPQGSDAIGARIDGAIIQLPTPSGLRSRLIVAADEIASALPMERAATITLLQPGCGALLARMLPRVMDEGATIQCVDGDPQTLAFVDAGLRAQPANIRLEMIHQDLVALSENGPTPCIEPADIIVCNGLVDHLPAGLIGSLLRWCRAHLAPEGKVVLTAMAPAADARFMEHMLRWPLMRRTPEELMGLFDAAGLEARICADMDKAADCGLVFVAEVSTKGQR